MKRGRPGLTLIEVLVVVAILAIIAGVGLPNLVGFLQRSRARGAADILASSIREARGRAIASAWQYRVFGFNDGGGTPNQFRIEGRIDNVTLWPDPNTAGPLATATTWAGEWISMAREYPGIRLNVGDPGVCPDPLGGGPNSFCVTYASTGLMTTFYLGPTNVLQVMGPDGSPAKSVTATLAGGVRVQ